MSQDVVGFVEEKLQRGTYGGLLQLGIFTLPLQKCLLSSNFINNLQHMVHDHIVSVLWRKYSFDYFHCFTVGF